jgi:hypothetical protein
MWIELTPWIPEVCFENEATTRAAEPHAMHLGAYPLWSILYPSSSRTLELQVQGSRSLDASSIQRRTRPASGAEPSALKRLHSPELYRSS